MKYERLTFDSVGKRYQNKRKHVFSEYLLLNNVKHTMSFLKDVFTRQKNFNEFLLASVCL